MVNKDALFDELSKKIPAGNYTTFCNQMGVNYNKARSILIRFKEDYNMALRDLLSQWDLKMRGVTRKQLEDALDKAGVGGLCFVVKKHYEKDSSRQHGAAGQNHPSPSPDAGPSRPPTPPDDKWKNHTVTPAESGPDESNLEMQYVMWESHVKGNALVIGNSIFPKKGELPAASPRPWADLDIYNMYKLLDALGYNVETGQNLSKLGIEHAVKLFTEHLEGANPKPQSAVVYISSHGNAEGIEGFDRNTLPIPDLLKMFSGVMLGKPKVLIIDACWGDDETSRLPVAASSLSGVQTTTILPENADIFMIHSTSYGKKTWSSTTYGSWIVDELCKVVYNNDRDLEDLDTIMLRVTKGVRTIRCVDKGGKDVGTQSTTVFKQGVDRKLFFYPGFPPTNV